MNARFWGVEGSEDQQPGGRFRQVVAAVSVALAAGTGWASAARATTWYAANNGLDDNPCTKTAPCRSVTKTMAVAAEGDTIVVGPGLYGDLNRDGIVGNTAGEETSGNSFAMIDVTKGLSIISSDGAWATVIDANGAATAAVHIEANGTVFGKANKGFTIRNKNAAEFTGLIVWTPGDPQAVPTDVTVQGNVAESNYHGFVLGGTRTLAKGNVAISNENGFFIHGTEAVISGNLAQSNGGGF